MKSIPSVLHIGFSKCASTYIRALFRANAKVELVFKSGFFTPFLSQEMSFAEYQSLFVRDGAITIESDEHLTLPGIHPDLGVRTTNLEEFEAVADKVRAFLPNVRILMVIRNQASLIVSRYSEYLIGGGSLQFEEFASSLMGNEGGPNRYYQNYYFRLIQLLEQRFPKANLLVLVQEAMREHSDQMATRISQFVAMEDTNDLPKGLRSERRSLSHLGMKTLRNLNRYMVVRPSHGGTAPVTRVPLAIFTNVVRLVRAIDFHLLRHVSPASSKVLTELRRRSILRHFEEDNLSLQAYFGVDLQRFGYFADRDRVPDFQ